MDGFKFISKDQLQGIIFKGNKSLWIKFNESNGLRLKLESYEKNEI